jgi:hypothetical protein
VATVPGLVHIISAMEACDTYKPWHDKHTHRTFLRPDMANACITTSTSVEFCWTGMALIPLGLGRFADGPDTRRESNAMRHQSSTRALLWVVDPVRY